MSDTLFIGGTSFKIADIESCNFYTRNNEVPTKSYDPGYLIVRTGDGSINRFDMAFGEAGQIVRECRKLRMAMIDELNHEELTEAAVSDELNHEELTEAAAPDKIRIGNTIIDRSYFDNVSRMTLRGIVISAVSAVEGECHFSFKTAEDASAAFDKLQTYLNAETL